MLSRHKVCHQVCHPNGVLFGTKRKLSKREKYSASKYRNLHNLHFDVHMCNSAHGEDIDGIRANEWCKTIFDNKLKSVCNSCTVLNPWMHDSESICWRLLFLMLSLSFSWSQTILCYVLFCFFISILHPNTLRKQTETPIHSVQNVLMQSKHLFILQHIHCIQQRGCVFLSKSKLSKYLFDSAFTVLHFQVLLMTNTMQFITNINGMS